LIAHAKPQIDKAKIENCLLEIAVFSLMFNRPVAVWMSMSPDLGFRRVAYFNLGQNIMGTVHLLFEGNNHYNSFVPFPAQPSPHHVSIPELQTANSTTPTLAKTPKMSKKKLYKTISVTHKLTEEEVEWPIHSAPVPPINLEALAALQPRSKYCQRFRRDMQWLTDEQLYHNLIKHVNSENAIDNPDEFHVSNIKANQASILHRDGITGPAGTIHATLRLFPIAERAKRRLRIIGWPKYLNQLLEDSGWCSDIDLASTVEQLAQVHAGPYAACADLKAGFYQFPLSPSVSSFFAFCDESLADWDFKRLVMGFRPAAQICHTGLGLISDPLDVECSAPVAHNIHVDNTRFVGLANDVSKCIGATFNRGFSVNATFNPEDVNTPHTVGEYCGVLYNYTHKRVQIGKKHTDRITKMERIINDSHATVQDMQELFGCLFFASAVLQAPLYKFYYAIKQYRRRLSSVAKGKHKAESPVKWWASAKAQLIEWLEFLRPNTPVVPKRDPNSPSQFHLFTDASKDGWGAVLIDHGTSMVYTSGGTWTDTRLWHKGWTPHINQLEVLAAHQAAVYQDPGSG